MSVLRWESAQDLQITCITPGRRPPFGNYGLRVPDDDSIVRPVVRSLDPLWFPPDNVPTDLSDFGCLVYLLIGGSEVGGVDKFHCFACSPRWLADKLSGVRPPPEHGMFLDRSSDDEIIFGSGLVLMNTWSPSALRIAIRPARSFS